MTQLGRSPAVGAYRALLAESSKIQAQQTEARVALAGAVILGGLALAVARWTQLGEDAGTPAAWAVLALLSIASLVASARGTYLARQAFPVRDKSVLATLTLARHHNKELDAALYQVERQRRALTRAEAARLLARHMRDF